MICQSTWIAQVVLGAPVKQLSVRGIEIPHLDCEARSILVGELTPVLAERNDMEICMEWFNPVRVPSQVVLISSLTHLHRMPMTKTPQLQQKSYKLFEYGYRQIKSRNHHLT